MTKKSGPRARGRTEARLVVAGYIGGAVPYADLASLYGVETKALVRAMKRNIDRFPRDFMFQLTADEFADLRYQIGTSNLRSQFVTSSWGGRRYRPYAFTEQGVAMLSSVLRSRRAVRVNVEIMRAFVRLRQVLATNAELARRLDNLEAKVGTHDEQFVAVIRAIRELMEPPPDPPRRRIGFTTEAEGVHQGRGPKSIATRGAGARHQRKPRFS